MNIFRDDKSFALKSALPKLILWILAVPFTWFIVSATLSVTNVLTASVLSLPFDTIKTSDNKLVSEVLDTINIPEVTTFDLDWSTLTWTVSVSKDKQTTLRKLLETENWAYNLLPVYAYWIFKIQDYDKLDDWNIKTVTSINELFKKLITWAFFAVVFGILVIAIAFALFTRMAMLWIFAMFSPFFALNIFLWSAKIKALEKIQSKLSITKFISLAMVPVYVSAALSFWLMFLSITQNNISWVWATNKTTVFSKCDWIEDCQKMKIFWLTLQIKGKWAAKWAEGADGAKELTTWFIGQMIMSILALIILWMVVMAALWADEITKAAVEPIAKFWWDIWKLLVDAPKYIPLKIPGTGKSISMTWLQSMGSNITTAISGAAATSWWEYGTKFGTAISEAMWNHVDKVITASSTYRAQNPWTDDPNTWIKIKGYIDRMKSMKSIPEMLSSEKERKELVSWLGQYMFKDSESKQRDEFIKKASGNIRVEDLAETILKSWANAWLLRKVFWNNTNEAIQILKSWWSAEPNTNTKLTLVKDSIKKDWTWTKIEINVKWKDNKDNPIVLSMTKVNNIDTIKRADLEKALKDKWVEDSELLTSILDELKKDAHKVNIS